jgi:tRNA G18 (ribose-2'-O)-methylase SpoU
VGQRPAPAPIPAGARTVVVLEDLVDVDNVGAVIRNAAAFDADALVLSPRSADPFYRKAIRVSMGSVFFIPIQRCGRWPDDLARLRADHGLRIVGAVLDPTAVPLASFVWPERVALLVGAEGPGLSAAARGACDHLVTIPMARAKADSLNVATATGIFLHARAAGRITT